MTRHRLKRVRRKTTKACICYFCDKKIEQNQFNFVYSIARSEESSRLRKSIKICQVCEDAGEDERLYYER